MKIYSPLVALLLASCAASPPRMDDQAAQPLPEVGGSSIGYQSVQQALDALRLKPGVVVEESEGWTIITDKQSEKSNSIWSFAPTTHPAYPAAVKRTIFERNGAVQIEMNVLCQAKKAPCDQLVRDFQALTEQLKARMRGGS